MGRLSGREIARRRRERECYQAMVAWLQDGDYAEAASRLFISETTLRRRIKEYVGQSGHKNVAQAAYWLDR